MKRLPEVNLLKRETFTSSPNLFILSWALTVGRWLVIGTQLVVIAAFAWRLNLDYQSSILKDEIRDKVQLIELQSQTEKKYRETYSKLNSLSQAMNSQRQIVGVLNEIGKRMPPSLALNTISWNGKELMVDGYSKTEEEISLLENNMRASTLFNKVIVTQVELSEKEKERVTPDVEYLFKLTADIKI